MTKCAIYILILAGVFTSVFFFWTARPNSNIGDHQYIPLYATHTNNSNTKHANSKVADYHWAGTSRTVQDAASRWQAYLKKHCSRDFFEDGPDLYSCLTAQYELMRTYYLLGETKKGDAIFANNDPLDLLPKHINEPSNKNIK